MLTQPPDSAPRARPGVVAVLVAAVMSAGASPLTHAQSRTVVYGYEVHKNPSIAMSKAALLQIAEINPMAAGMLIAFQPERRFPSLNILQGSASSASRPTAATVVLQLEGDKPNDDAYSKTMLPLEAPGEVLQTSWSSRLTDIGNLEVTFETRRLDEKGASLGMGFPSVRIEISNSTPSQLLGWTSVR